MIHLFKGLIKNNTTLSSILGAIKAKQKYWHLWSVHTIENQMLIKYDVVFIKTSTWLHGLCYISNRTHDIMFVLTLLFQDYGSNTINWLPHRGQRQSHRLDGKSVEITTAPLVVSVDRCSQWQVRFSVSANFKPHDCYCNNKTVTPNL